MSFVFLLAFGVSFYSLVFGVQEFTWHLSQALETFEENFKANGYTAFILLLGYMTIVSILLVNPREKLSLDDKSITKIETTEDAYGDEVYYNYLKQERKLLDEPDLDEERV
ncbi:unnamed protein product [Rotaria sordida]|uniref:Uncharacterized protein n=1 Tax=Rotaria sordida TaxID=392033 RepID=A0A815GXR2_9BILA|nr:unnamed protein product [Rotaria sordida]CAF1598549.1 unnamed protein product [Rotaria sordida]